MAHAWEKGFLFGKKDHTWKNVSHFKKKGKRGVTLGKKCQTWKNRSHLRKWLTLGKLCRTLKSGPDLEKTVPNLEKRVTL